LKCAHLTASPRAPGWFSNLDNACEACHRSYWYPGEGAEFYQKLRQRLENYRQQSPGSTSVKPRTR